MKRIYFDENDKLVIETDNGRLENNGKEPKVDICGEFQVDAENLAKILAMMEGSTMYSQTSKHNHLFALTYEVITGNEATANMIANIETKWRNDLKLEKDYASRLRQENEHLIDLIREHNLNCGLFHKTIKM